MKTVFIVVTRGFIIRNMLRSGVLAHLQKAGVRVVIFFANVRNKSLPESLRQEFENDSTFVEVLSPDTDTNTLKEKLYSLFKNIAPYFVYSGSTWAYSRSGNKEKTNRHIFWAYVERIIYTPLSKLHFLKRAARVLEEKFFREGTYAEYFDTYKPDVVFSTSIVSKHDMEFMKEAKHRGVPTVSMCKGWDNITKMLLRLLPSTMIVQNHTLKNDMIQVQRMNGDNVQVCGFGQFDWYRRPEILLSREEFFKKLGLPSERRLIFFGSEGCWAPDDDKIADVLAKFVNEENTLVKPCSLLVRPHFSDVTNPRFERFKNIKNVKLDDNYNFSDFFIDNWNPSVEETKFFINCMYHCDIMVMTASTLALDAVCFDKPILGIAYNVLRHQITGQDLSLQLYETDHFQAVLKTQALDLITSDKSLQKAINNVLLHPEYKQEERKNLLDSLCYKVDGKSSERIAEVILAHI